MATGVTLTGDKQIKANLTKVQKQLIENTKQALDLVGQDGVGTLKRNTPRVTGLLLNSMAYEVDNRRQEVVIGTNVVYAASVEFRSTNGSEGFFLRSFNATVPRAKAIFKKLLGV